MLEQKGLKGLAEYESSFVATSVAMRKGFPRFYRLVNHMEWNNALICLDNIQAVVEQYLASHSEYTAGKIREKIDSIRVTLATPSVDYWKRKALNLKLHNLVSSLIKIGAPLG